MLRYLLIFVSGLLLGYLLHRPRVLSWPVAGTVDYQPHVTWSYAPPNPGSWN